MAVGPQCEDRSRGPARVTDATNTGGSPVPHNMYRAGTASTIITPNEPMWLAGYAVRTRPASGKLSDLYAKALALEDDRGE